MYAHIKNRKQLDCRVVGSAVQVFYIVTVLLLQNFYLKKKRKKKIPPSPNDIKNPIKPKGISALCSEHIYGITGGSCSLQSPNPCATTADWLPYKPPTSCCWHWELLPKRAWQLGEPGTRVSSHSGDTPQWQVSLGCPSYTADRGIHLEITSSQERETGQDHCRSAPKHNRFEKIDVAQSRGAGILLRFLTLGRKEWWICIYEVL